MEGITQIPERQKYPIKQGVDLVFERTPEFFSIGTKEQYSEYLEKVFPESKVRELLWHGSLNNITDNFKNNQHFGSLEAAKSRNEFKKQVISDMSREEYYFPAILNIKNIKRTEDVDYAWDKEIARAKEEGYDGIVYLNNNEGKNKDSYLVFESNQIHILGSKSDIEKFKNFVSQ